MKCGRIGVELVKIKRLGMKGWIKELMGQSKGWYKVGRNWVHWTGIKGGMG